jgi:hypothetical protein
MAEHQIVKPEVLAMAALGLLEDQVVVPNLIQRESVDRYKGAKDDTINVRVPGILPFNEYAWRNDRSEGIKFDELTETTRSVSFSGNVYSAVKVTDEQNDFDIDSWGRILEPQSRAVARGLERKAIDEVEGADYQVVLGGVEEKGNFNRLVEARRVLNRFNAPDASQRILLVGTDFEANLLNDPAFHRADSVGDTYANLAVREAVIGRLAGFTIVTSNEIDPGAGYAFVPSAFVLATGAPSVPAGVASGATISDRSFALRWVRDYDSEHMQERSVVNTYAGARSIVDRLIGWDKSAGKEVITKADYFVRGVKLTLDGTDVYPGATTELAKVTGVKAPTVTAPSGS